MHQVRLWSQYEMRFLHKSEGRGAFYVFVNIKDLAMPSLDFARHLVKEAGVVTANGSGFGAEGYIRLSYAAKIEQIDEALDRIAAVVGRLP